ncbi:hypothetical protein V8C26DRAFT_277078 [Trichoderma gracile]
MPDNWKRARHEARRGVSKGKYLRALMTGGLCCKELGMLRRRVKGGSGIKANRYASLFCIILTNYAFPHCFLCQTAGAIKVQIIYSVILLKTVCLLGACLV